jgi:hypothetical protein
VQKSKRKMEVASAFLADYERSQRAAVLRYLGTGNFLFAGTWEWAKNGIKLGQTQVHPIQIIYNSTLEGLVAVPGVTARCKFMKRRFPRNPSKEFWVIDLLNNPAWVDVPTKMLVTRLIKLINEKILTSIR